MSTRLLCGVPIDIQGDRATSGVFAALRPTEEAATLSLHIEETVELPSASGTLLFRSPDFEARERGGTVELTIRDGADPVAWAQLSAQGEVTLRLRTNLSPVECSLRDELLPELIVAHLWPLRGLGYLHAAATLGKHGARLFLGPSGRGKSTAATLLSKAGEPLFCVDRCAVSPMPAWAAAAPWHGGQPNAGERTTLCEVFALSRIGPPRRRQLSASDALTALSAGAFLPRWWPAGLDAALDVLVQLARSVPVFELCSEPDQRLVQRVQGAA